ncbi:hypothetical protein GQ42DRAFT_83188 [Ramicandelaber brevisporus]|nr:hypothetical protein GQ42DRAFT_83188 [Ramicandelaber brevisporus]
MSSLDAHIVAAGRSLTQVVGEVVGFYTVVSLVGILISRRLRLTAGDTLSFTWALVSIVTTASFEVRWLFIHDDLKAAYPDNIGAAVKLSEGAGPFAPLLRMLDESWILYALACDKRYLTEDTTLRVLESLNIYILIPLFSFAALAIAGTASDGRFSANRHMLQLLACFGQLFGMWFYFGGEVVMGLPSMHPSLTFGAYLMYFVVANAPWVFMPVIMIGQSWGAFVKNAASSSLSNAGETKVKSD